MATSDHDFKYDGQVTITLALHDDEISVWPSNELKGGVAISLLDSEEPRTNVVIASPAEWDAFVAAGNAALGRPAPISTPLEERIAASLRGAQQAKPFAADQGRAQAIVEVWERAQAMARETSAPTDRYAPARELVQSEPLCASLAEQGATVQQALDAITTKMIWWKEQAHALMLRAPHVMAEVDKSLEAIITGNPESK